MKRLVVCIFTILCILQSVNSQENKQKFSPAKFQAELEAFITKEACLTTNEANAFFPLFREMGKKQRGVYQKMRKLGFEKPKTEEECKNVIIQRDRMDMELKKIQQTYHNKFLEILPACKVFDVIKAEDRFHRRVLKKWSHNNNPTKKH
jgi:hypothetical protein